MPSPFPSTRCSEGSVLLVQVQASVHKIGVFPYQINLGLLVMYFYLSSIPLSISIRRFLVPPPSFDPGSRQCLFAFEVCSSSVFGLSA